jgi:hypothetical protein
MYTSPFTIAPNVDTNRLVTFMIGVLLLAVTLGVSACGGGSSGGRQLLSLSVTPSDTSVPVGLTKQFKATGTYSDASTADITNNVTWSSGSSAFATINAATGLATSVATGSTSIIATLQSVSGSTTLNVTAAIVQSIAITPNPAFTGIGTTRQLTAIGTFSDGSTAAVTDMATWSSGSAAVVTVGATTGLATGVSQGSGTISATIGSIAASASLSVVANAWVSTGNLSNARFSPTATLLANGTVLAAGGELIDAALSSAELYDPIAGTWSPTGSMNSPRAEDSATLLTNGKVLVAGGTGNISVLGNNPYDSAELYDPNARTWTSAGVMSQVRFNHTATLLANGSVLVAGGEPGGSGPTAAPVSGTEIFDPVAVTWTPTGSMTTARSRQSATLLPNGKVLVAGGYNYSGGSLPLASAEIYDPVAGTWTATGSMSTGRELQSATLLANGKVLVAGGSDAVGASASAEIYDPLAATWTLTGSMSAARESPSATLLPNGSVLVVGGGPAGAEIYDPASGTWSPAGSLSAANTTVSGAATTLLPDGSVLAVGGLPPAPPTTTSSVGAEIYY